MIPIQELYVFRITPNKKVVYQESDIIGGKLEVTDATRAIFATSFDGRVGRGVKLQPFHFKLEGDERKNAMRDAILDYLLHSQDEVRLKVLTGIAFSLTKMIDNRTGDLLLTVAWGKSDEMQKIAFWAYPQDDPIQLATEE